MEQQESRDGTMGRTARIDRCRGKKTKGSGQLPKPDWCFFQHRSSTFVAALCGAHGVTLAFPPRHTSVTVSSVRTG